MLGLRDMFVLWPLETKAFGDELNANTSTNHLKASLRLWLFLSEN